VRVPVTLAHPNRMSRSWRTARTALSTHRTVSAEIIHSHSILPPLPVRPNTPTGVPLAVAVILYSFTDIRKPLSVIICRWWHQTRPSIYACHPGTKFNHSG
jgi:hypothetical protein